MPAIANKELSIAFDLCGCPNRCRHCWLGRASRRRIPLADAVDVFVRARDFVQDGGALPHLEGIRFFGGTVREPHYGDDYREVRERELELNGGVDYAAGFELLSVWRLAREPGYARWAHEIGTRRCQLTLFGLEDVTDWFYRRRGAFSDIRTATLRLMENGIQPRWQVFLTKKGISDLPGIWELAEELRLHERCAELSSPFELFLNDPTPIGEARGLMDLRLTPEDLGRIPADMVTATERYTKRQFCLLTEAGWISEILGRPDEPIGLDESGETWFFVTPDWNVYSNRGSLEPWWRLGNCRTDGTEAAIKAFVDDSAQALAAASRLGLHEAARAYGRLRGERLFISERDLRQYWLELHCGGPTPAGVH
jgi:MoaA/NifB/PqqE/SkfB family radical SAM enzyme